MQDDSNTPAHTTQNLREELNRLKTEQDEAMRQAVYVGMSMEEAKQVDQRRKRIYELYEQLLIQERSGTQS